MCAILTYISDSIFSKFDCKWKLILCVLKLKYPKYLKEKRKEYKICVFFAQNKLCYFESSIPNNNNQQQQIKKH